MQLKGPYATKIWPPFLLQRVKKWMPQYEKRIPRKFKSIKQTCPDVANHITIPKEVAMEFL